MKSFMPGMLRVADADTFTMYNKIGRAYGCSVDNAYVEDHSTGRAFFLSAVIYTNPNETMNDGIYGYKELADPFMAAIGEIALREPPE